MRDASIRKESSIGANRRTVMSELGDKIVAEARTWVGTPFGHQKMVKGVRCDCFGVVRASMEAATGLRYEGIYDYPHRPHAPTLIAGLNKYFVRVYPPAGERLADYTQLGDILLFKIDGNPQHLAIRTDKGMIHGYALGPRRVEEISFAPPWSTERLVGVWRMADRPSSIRGSSRKAGEPRVSHPAHAGLLRLEKASGE
jgi:cell wall-associated NlpC family hydrolase